MKGCLLTRRHKSLVLDANEFGIISTKINHILLFIASATDLRIDHTLPSRSDSAAELAVVP